MAFTPKIWIDRSVEFAMRRLFTAVSGQANTYDIARVSGTVFAVGDEPDAATMNDLETRIAAGFTDVGIWTDISTLITKNITGLVINYALYNASTKEVKIDISIDVNTITIANDVDVITIPLAYRPTSEIILKGCGSAKISSNAASADWLNFYQIKISPTGFVRHNYMVVQNMYYYRANFSYIVR